MALKRRMAEDAGMYDDGASDVSVSLDVDGKVPL
jgi:hypothetical protein